MSKETAVFGGGCFWCIEAIYKRIKGVESVVPGYAGGNVEQPIYNEVCRGDTGHAEVIKIEYDPEIISYKDLLDIFWHAHDPTTKNRQGNDVGSQYRSIILFQNEDQRKKAEHSKEVADAGGMFRKPIVTEIKALEEFYEAEDYHHDYFASNPNQPYCRAIISPKVQHFMKDFPERL